MTPPVLLERRVVKLDGEYLVMDIRRWADLCRVDVVHCVAPGAPQTLVMVQIRETMELAVAAIARDLTTFAARALAALPTIGTLVDDYDEPDDEPDDEEVA